MLTLLEIGDIVAFLRTPLAVSSDDAIVYDLALLIEWIVARFDHRNHRAQRVE